MAEAVTDAEAVPLVSALVAHVARDVGVRAFLVKGPLLAELGLREPRASGDVDVWCDPAEVERLTAGLQAHGWRLHEFWPNAPALAPKHSRDLVHDAWPVGIDVHHEFPGFADPAHSFDVLWSRCVDAELAHQPVPYGDLPAVALVQALHLLRNPHVPTYAHDLDHLVDVVARWGPDDKADLAGLAADTGSADTAAPFLDRVGAPPVGRGTTDAAVLTQWRMRQASTEVPMLYRIEELRTSRLRDWPAIIWRASTPTLEDIPAGETRGRLTVAWIRVRRTVRGAWRAPRATFVRWRSR